MPYHILVSIAVFLPVSQIKTGTTLIRCILIDMIKCIDKLLRYLTDTCYIFIPVDTA